MSLVVGRFREIEQVVQGLLLDEGKQMDHDRAAIRGGVGAVPESAWRQLLHRVVIVMHGHAYLFEIVAALHAAGRFARRLHGRQEQRDEHADNRNDHEQFHERERSAQTLSHDYAPPFPPSIEEISSAYSRCFIQHRRSPESNTDTAAFRAGRVPRLKMFACVYQQHTSDSRQFAGPRKRLSTLAQKP